MQTLTPPRSSSERVSTSGNRPPKPGVQADLKPLLEVVLLSYMTPVCQSEAICVLTVQLVPSLLAPICCSMLWNILGLWLCTSQVTSFPHE